MFAVTRPQITALYLGKHELDSHTLDNYIKIIFIIYIHDILNPSSRYTRILKDKRHTNSLHYMKVILSPFINIRRFNFVK
jgi:hypothetical protein